MFQWFAATLRLYPEIAVFLSLAIGYYFGSFSYKGFGLGAVTSTLLAAILIGQIGITISPNVKSIFFLMFLFAVGYGVGPQFIRGIASDGLPQAIFAAIVSLFSLGAAVIIAKLAGYHPGYAAGLYAGSQTISASMGLATDAINRLGLPPDQAKAMLNDMPVAYAVTYIYGTIGSAVVLAMLAPKLLRIDLVAACKAYEERSRGTVEMGGAGSAWHRWELRAFRVANDGQAVGLPAIQAEALVRGARVFIQRIRRDGKIIEANAETALQAGDVVAVSGPRDVLVDVLGKAAQEVNDPELLHVPIEGVDVYVTSKDANGKTLQELASMPMARGIFLRRIVRGATATVIPILPDTRIQRGDILTIVGRTQDTTAAAKVLGVLDRPSDVADVAFIGAAITLGALVGAIVLRISGVPLTISTAGGVSHFRTDLWLATLGEAVIRPHPVIYFVVHELGRLERLHRRDRHYGGTRFRRRITESRDQLVHLGHHRDLGAIDPGGVFGKIRIPLRSGSLARLLRRCPYNDGGPRHDLRKRPKPGSGTGLHRDLCGGQHTAHDMGDGRRHAGQLSSTKRRVLEWLPGGTDG